MQRADQSVHPQIPSPELVEPYITRSLQELGYVLLPGLAHWYSKLRPELHPQAWDNFRRTPMQEFNTAAEGGFYGLQDDSGIVTHQLLPRLSFKTKENKSHLTIVQGADGLLKQTGYPIETLSYLNMCVDFLSYVKGYFQEVLPLPSLPTILQMRIFKYEGGRSTPAMREHCDASVVTLVLAQSDSLLEIETNEGWMPVVRRNKEPFALLFPGMAALHDLNVLPLPHRVRPCITGRESITVFLSPYLGTDYSRATRILRRWDLA